MIRELAAGLRFPEGPVSLSDGSVLVVELAAGRLSRVRPDGTIEIVAETGGAPNGAAMGPDGRCYLCNNGGFSWRERDGRLFPITTASDYAGGWIEAVDLDTGAVEVLYRASAAGPLKGPNDLVFDSCGGFWFTDHGHTHRETRDRGAILYATPDGSHIERVVFPMESPNGIGLSPDGKILYVAETMTARLWAFDVIAPGKLDTRHRNFLGGIGRLVVGLGGFQLCDSLAVDSGGVIWLATIPNGVTAVSPDGRVLAQYPMPEPIVTNVCFDVRNPRKLYVTLSSTGRLVEMKLPD